MKTALIHDWLVTIGGGEKPLEAIWSLYPSPIYALIKDKKALQGSYFADKDIRTSSLQKLPKVSKYYRNLLPFFPFAIEQFDLSGYDLILSTSHAVAKGVLTHSHQLHICYCHSPMRYAWDLYHHYLKDVRGIRATVAKWSLHYLRNWDISSLNRVDHFIANSNYTAKRIKKFYGRDSKVIYPPVNTHLFTPEKIKDDFYLTVSRMVPYKKIDLIVEAFSQMPDKKLVVIGDGPEMHTVKAKAKKNIEILGSQSDAVVRSYFERAKAFVFAAEEDFGIVSIEAQAAGTPVIAFGRGGVLETVIENETGVFFKEQSPQSLIETINTFEKRQDKFDVIKIIKNAEKFSVQNFMREYKEFVEQKKLEHYESRHLSGR